MPPPSRRHWGCSIGGLQTWVLVDINLGLGSGLELVEQMHKSSALRHIPAFAVTVLDERDDIRRIRAVGCSGHFVKPVDVNALEIAVREVLGS